VTHRSRSPADEARVDLLVEATLSACADVKTAATELEAAMHDLRERRAAGKPPEVLGGADLQGTWTQLYSAVTELREALADARAEAYRYAVDVAGFSLSDLARYSGRSRQFVSRMVERGRAAHPPDP
jgi:hypothetical protein